MCQRRSLLVRRRNRGVVGCPATRSSCRPASFREVVEAGYEAIELGPYGYLPGDPAELQVELTGGAWGGQITPSFVERFGEADDTQRHRWVDAARNRTIDGPGACDGYAAVNVCEAVVEAVRTAAKVTVVTQTKPESNRDAGIVSARHRRPRPGSSLMKGMTP